MKLFRFSKIQVYPIHHCSFAQNRPFLYIIHRQYEDGPQSRIVGRTLEYRPAVSPYLYIDYLNGREPFGRYNFFNILATIGTGRRPLKDHPPKVGRLPRRHRKTPSSGSGVALVISRKPRHFACIIHCNSPPFLPNSKSGAATEKNQRKPRSFRFLVPPWRALVPDMALVFLYFYSTLTNYRQSPQIYSPPRINDSLVIHSAQIERAGRETT